MYRCMDATNNSAALFFVVAVVAGSYVLLNLFLAVLKLKFATAQQQLLNAQAKIKKMRAQPRSSIIFFIKGLRNAGLLWLRHLQQEYLCTGRLGCNLAKG